eukprot:560139-Pelagomonas_calceolata.AAC.1
MLRVSTGNECSAPCKLMGHPMLSHRGAPQSLLSLPLTCFARAWTPIMQRAHACRHACQHKLQLTVELHGIPAIAVS